MSERIFDAIEFAVKAHRGQYRKGTNLPYILHPLAVARILMEHDCPEELAIAALLHDTVEDTPVTLDEIRKRFGERVAWLVQQVSEPEKSEAWENRKRHTLEHLRTAPMEVLLLACADKLDNIRAIRDDYERLGEAIWRRFKRGKGSQAWYYRALADLFLERMRDDAVGIKMARQLAAEVESVFGEQNSGLTKRCLRCGGG